MEVILDELTPKEFFSNGGVVKIKLVSELLKKRFKGRNKFLFYEYKMYLRFLRELYLKYIDIYPDLKPDEVYKEILESLEISCSIGTKEYTIDPNFDKVHSLEFCNFYYCYDNLPSRKNEEKIDIYGMENVNFSLVNIDDSRWEKFKEQRMSRGFDDSELWNLFETFAMFILPRLKVFRDKHFSTPANMSNEEWNGILDGMITAFELITSEYSDDEDERIDLGLKLFSKYFLNLWD